MSSGITILTLIHVALSLIGIIAGLVVLAGLLTARTLDRWSVVFLITTVATSLTGFLFPYHGFIPAIGVGIVSLVVLTIAIFARYSKRLAGAWRWIYVVTAMLALYLNVFVLVVQAFMKVPSLKALAPTQHEPPLMIAQLAVLVLFVALTVSAVIKFRRA